MVVPAYAHVVGSVGCVPIVMSTFLDRGSAKGLDVSCAHREPPPTFELG